MTKEELEKNCAEMENLHRRMSAVERNHRGSLTPEELSKYIDRRREND